MPNINIKVGDPDDSLPDGLYECTITWWGLPKPTKAQTGFVTCVSFDVNDDDFAGRKIFENLNLTNNNKIAEKIAEKTKNSILIAAGFNVDDIITSTQQIEGRKICIQLTNENGDQKKKYIKPDDVEQNQTSGETTTIQQNETVNPIVGSVNAPEVDGKEPWAGF